MNRRDVIFQAGNASSSDNFTTVPKRLSQSRVTGTETSIGFSNNVTEIINDVEQLKSDIAAIKAALGI